MVMMRRNIGLLMKTWRSFKRDMGAFQRRWQQAISTLSSIRHHGGAPDLQRMALRILSLTSSSSGCERNWSTFEQVHTKRRNMLTAERLNRLVYIQFNNRLMSKREKIRQKTNYEVLQSFDSAEAQGFFYKGGDAHALVLFRDEDEGEVPGTGIPWTFLGEAMGADEALQPRRSVRTAREVDEEEWESEEEGEAGDDTDDDIDYEDQDDGEEIPNTNIYVA